MYKNVRIEKIDTCNYLVFADSQRFGENEIVYQGISLKHCFEWIAKHAQKSVYVENGKIYFLVKNTKNTYAIGTDKRVKLVNVSPFVNELQKIRLFNVSPCKVTKKVKDIIEKW